MARGNPPSILAALAADSMFSVRRAGPQDSGFLLQVLAIAADWRPGAPTRSAEAILAAPELAHYVPDLSAGRDRGVIAEDEPGRSVGAAWWRFLPADDPGYGFVSPDVPELTVGVVQSHRHQRIGTALLRELARLAGQEGLPGLSLSVEPENFAVDLYDRLGFVQVGRTDGAPTMFLAL